MERILGVSIWEGCYICHQCMLLFYPALEWRKIMNVLTICSPVTGTRSGGKTLCMGGDFTDTENQSLSAAVVCYSQFVPQVSLNMVG